jgi:hypothetical protein
METEIHNSVEKTFRKRFRNTSFVLPYCTDGAYCIVLLGRKALRRDYPYSPSFPGGSINETLSIIWRDIKINTATCLRYWLGAGHLCTMPMPELQESPTFPTQKEYSMSLSFFRYFFAVALVTCLFCSSAIAQASAASSSPVVPRLVSFSGKAVDPQGKPITGIVGITFAIYQEQSEGAALWLESQNVTADKKGNYTTQIGATKTEGLPIDLFSSGAARWLGVAVNGGAEQPRVLLLSVPYALKAADAETVGGLPPSAFLRAAPSSNPLAATIAAGAVAMPANTQPAVQPATTPTGSGTTNFVPLWTSASALGDSVLFQSGAGTTAKLGLNTTTPTSTLDVKGASTIRGLLLLPATANATSTAGANSQALSLVASSYNSSTPGATNVFFNWQAEAVGNNTAAPTATLNLLFGSGAAKAAETGLHIAHNGVITFAAGQTFPATGTVTSVALTAPGADFTVTGSPVTKSGTLGLNWKIAPTSADTANAIVKRDSTGSFAAGGITSSLGISSTIGAGNAVSGSTNSGIGVYGESSGTGSGMNGVEGDSSAQAGSGVAGINSGGGIGVYGQGGTGVVAKGSTTGVFGTGTSYGFDTDSNVHQARAASGWAKAMVTVNGSSAPYKILRCFNSTLPSSTASTVPCGFNLVERAPGQFTIDFGFEVDDRFWSVSAEGYHVGGDNGAIITNAFASAVDFGSNSILEVDTYTDSGDYQGAQFTVVIF